MKTSFVYPGSFCPPTFGHFRVVTRAAEVFPEVVIVCSSNEEKKEERWFSEEECKAMWRFYDLPKNVSVKTFAKCSQENIDPGSIVMIRGIRDDNDMEDEKRVLKFNKEKFGIDKAFYLMAENGYEGISSKEVRKAATNLDFQTLAKCVHPRIVNILLEKTLKARNLFLVVGKPGSGKSTFLKMLSEIDNACVHINTDSFSKTLKPLLLEKFGNNIDLIAMAIRHDREFTSFITPLWFQLLKEELLKVPSGSNIFLEIPYGLRPGVELFPYVGGKILYVGCENQAENQQRITGRGTKEHIPFISEIPNLEESRKISEQNRLDLISVDSSGNIEDLREKAEGFARWINPKKEARYA